MASRLYHLYISACLWNGAEARSIKKVCLKEHFVQITSLRAICQDYIPDEAASLDEHESQWFYRKQ